MSTERQPRFELAKLNANQYDWAKKFPMHADEILSQAPDDKELFQAERAESLGKINDFFGLGENADPFQFVQFIDNTTSKLEEKYGENMFERKLDKVEAFSTKEVIERQEVPITTFERPRKKERGEEDRETIESKEFRLDFEQNSGYSKRAEAQRSQTYGNAVSGYTSSRSSTSSSNNRAYATSTSSNSNKREERNGPIKAIDAFYAMNDSVQRVGAGNVRGWSKKQEADLKDDFDKFGSPVRGWRKALRKVKKVMKSNKGRIMLKVGATIALQFGMAIFGKRYEFENAGQMAMMFSMMLGTFFLSRELAEDGIDISGFNIL